jgi:REP element-mobilizing transposase RayT
MVHPLAYFVTWTTYGTWLHGVENGSFDAAGNYILPDPKVRESAASLMVDDLVCLSSHQRTMLDGAIFEYCQLHQWVLFARNVRTNHVHVVVAAPLEGKVIRSRLKSRGSFCLSEDAGLGHDAGKNGVRKWWTEKGNAIAIWNERQLESIIRYVLELQ